jgi:YDG domain
MTFAQWLRQTFGSQGQIARAPRRGKSRQASRLRFVPRLDVMEDRLAPAILTVNSLLDNTIANDGLITLREAIAAANAGTNPNGGQTGVNEETIQFAAAIDGGTISLSTVGDGTSGPSAFRIGTGYTGDRLVIDGKTGLTKGITIERSSSATPFRLFYVDPTGNLTLQSLTLRGGLAQGGNGGTQSGAGGGGAAGLGGAIYNDGRLTLQDSTLTGNTAQGGAGGQGNDDGPGAGGGGLGGSGKIGGQTEGFYGEGGIGGGPNEGVGGNFNHTSGYAGAFGGGGGGGYSITLRLIKFKGPGAAGGFGGGGGGGGSGKGVVISITGENGGNGGFGGGGGGAGGGSYFGTAGSGGFGGGNAAGAQAGGGAGMGGAVFNEAGTVTITNSTFTGNKAIGGTGGGKGLGGGLFNHNGLIEVAVSTFSLNTAAQGGRGIFNLDDSATAIATARINNTILGQAGTTVEDFTGSGTTVTSGSGNLIRTQSGFTGSYITGDPKLGLLQDNGGLTPTMALAADSPAINGGTAPQQPHFDQRGAPRHPKLGVVDIGAFELRTLQTITFGALTNRTYGDADFAISATATSALPVSFTAGGNASVQQVAGVWYVHITGAGSATITAHQAGNDTYEPAPGVAQSFSIARAASVTTTVGAGPFTYNGTAQVGGSGTVTGAGGLNTSATSLTYSANSNGTGVADRTNAGTYFVTAHYAGDTNYTASDGAAVAIVINRADATVKVSGYTGVYDAAYHGATGSASGVGGESAGSLNLGATFKNVPGGTAHWVFTGNRNYKDQSGDVAISILARHITGAFTAADKIYDGNVSATVLTRSLTGVFGTDAVSLTGGTATFASKNVGTWTVTLAGAALSGGDAGNYALDSVATTTARITPKVLAGSTTTEGALNVAKNGTVSFRIDLDKSGIVDGQTVAQLFNGAWFRLTVGGQSYSIRAQAVVVGGTITVNFRMSAELKAILAANTKATNASNAPTVALTLEAMSKDGNYTLGATAWTKLFNTMK